MSKKLIISLAAVVLLLIVIVSRVVIYYSKEPLYYGKPGEYLMDKYGFRDFPEGKSLVKYSTEKISSNDILYNDEDYFFCGIINDSNIEMEIDIDDNGNKLYKIKGYKIDEVVAEYVDDNYCMYRHMGVEGEIEMSLDDYLSITNFFDSVSFKEIDLLQIKNRKYSIISAQLSDNSVVENYFADNKGIEQTNRSDAVSDAISVYGEFPNGEWVLVKFTEDNLMVIKFSFFFLTFDTSDSFAEGFIDAINNCGLEWYEKDSGKYKFYEGESIRAE